MVVVVMYFFRSFYDRKLGASLRISLSSAKDLIG